MRAGFWWVQLARWVFNGRCPFCGRRGIIAARFPYPCRRAECREAAKCDASCPPHCPAGWVA